MNILWVLAFFAATANADTFQESYPYKGPGLEQYLDKVLETLAAHQSGNEDATVSALTSIQQKPLFEFVGGNRAIKRNLGRAPQQIQKPIHDIVVELLEEQTNPVLVKLILMSLKDHENNIKEYVQALNQLRSGEEEGDDTMDTDPLEPYVNKVLAALTKTGQSAAQIAQALVAIRPIPKFEFLGGNRAIRKDLARAPTSIREPLHDLIVELLNRPANPVTVEIRLRAVLPHRSDIDVYMVSRFGELNWSIPESVGDVVDDAISGILKLADNLIDTVGAAASAIIITITGLVFAVLGIVISLTLTVLGLLTPFLSIAGLPLSVVAGLVPTVLGLVNTLLPTVLGLVDSLLGGLGKK